MAEPENLDDEFFADLYDDNDAAPHGTHKPEATEEAMGDAPDLGGQDSTYTDTHDRNGNGNGESHDMMEEEGEEDEEEEEEEDDDDIDFNLGNTAAHVPTAGIASHQDSPAPSFSAPPQAAPPQQQFQNQPSHQNNHHHHQGHGKNSNSKEDGKMFIGGLNWETTDQSLRDYFSQFGEVLECTVMRDSSTGRSRGFGFLTFKDAKTVNVVMVKEHHLDGKIIDPKRAIPRDEQEKTSKIFVGGVSQETTDQEFKDYFTQFGRVVDATLMMDKDTGRPRGFGFVTFESDAGVDACLTTSLQIHGKPIEVKKAQPRGNMREEEETSRRGGKYGKNKFGGGSNGGGVGGGGGSDNGGGSEAAMVAGPNGNANGMTPQAMAQMFQRVQQMVSMQQQFMMGRGGGQPMPAMPQMNPAMYQQMMQYQQMAMGRGGQGGGGPNSPMMPGMNGPMNPAMMQQMQQAMQQQMMAQGGGGNQGVGGQPQGAGGPNRPGYNAYEQQMFEQQKYERRHTRDQGGGSFGGSQAGGYGNQGWDGGMYEENMGGGGGGGGGSRGGGYRGGSRQDSQDPTNAPPANAPTGPKNAGKPGANFYRGGGRGGNRFHPYNR